MRKVQRFSTAGENLAFSVPNNSINNLERGLLERIFMVKTAKGLREPPQPVQGYLVKTLRQFKRKIMCYAPPTTKMDVKTFLASRPSRKRRVYENAFEDLKIREISRHDSVWDTFIKAEKMNLTSKPDPVPRLINPRSPRYNLLLGLYIKPAEHAIYHAIDTFMGARTVAKGRNAVERAEMLLSAWQDFDNPVAIGVDASRFDQHVSKQALEYEHSVYLALFQNDTELRRLLSWQLHNKGFAKSKTGGIRFEIEGVRGSGDMNTALGNVLLMCSMLWTFCKTFKIRARIVDDGDDAVVVVDRADEQKFYDHCKPWFLKLGFTMKYESSALKFEHIEFCQSQPVWDGSRYVMCRDPRIVLSKDLICVRGFNSRKQWKQLMGSVGLSGMSLAGNLPVFWKFYQTFQPGGERLMESGMDYLAIGMEFKQSEPTWDSRVSFFTCFGITPDEQLALESHYDTINTEWATPVLTGNKHILPIFPVHEILNVALNINRR